MIHNSAGVRFSDTYLAIFPSTHLPTNIWDFPRKHWYQGQVLSSSGKSQCYYSWSTFSRQIKAGWSRNIDKQKVSRTTQTFIISINMMAKSFLFCSSIKEKMTKTNKIRKLNNNWNLGVGSLFWILLETQVLLAFGQKGPSCGKYGSVFHYFRQSKFWVDF